MGRTGVVTKEIADYGAYINQHLTCIRLKKALHPLYVAYYMESEAGKMQFQSKNQNGVKAGLNFNAIKATPHNADKGRHKMEERSRSLWDVLEA